MAVTRMTSREFNQDTGGAKRAASSGPVYVTDRGEVSHVLLTFEEYERLALPHSSIVDLLGHPPGVENIDLDIPVAPDVAEPATFE